MKRPPVLASLAVIVLATAIACSGSDGARGPAGPRGDAGPAGPAGEAGAPAADRGTIAGSVKDAGGAALAGVAITTSPPSGTATSDASGMFSLSSVPIGVYSVLATKMGYATFTLAGVGVAARATTNVSLVLTVDPKAPGTVSGTVTNSKDTSPDPIAGATVTVDGQKNISATTDAKGNFTLTGVAPGPVFLTVTPPDLTQSLPSDTRSAAVVPAGGTVTGVHMVVSARPSDAAVYVGMSGTCDVCHGGKIGITGDKATAMRNSAHNRSLTRIARDANGATIAGAWARLLNPTLTTPRTVMIPLAGSITVAAGAVVTGAGTHFSTGGATNCGPAGNSPCALQPGDVLGYMPNGLGWTVVGTVQSVDSDTQLTLTAPATFAPGVTSLSTATKYGVSRLSYAGHTNQWPEDSNDIVAPAWPGVKATNPNYDPNDSLIYASSGAYADGQVNVYLCNLKGRTLNTNGAANVTFPNDEYVMKFGGAPYTCTDGAFWDGSKPPGVPLVRIDVLYGGCGDKDGSMAPQENVGVFKQRYQGHMADVKVVSTWTPAYATQADRDRDSLTLPIQVLESGDTVNGGFKMNGYHPTENKFPGESWTQRARTFSHACAGCHGTGLTISASPITVNLQIPREGNVTTMNESVITAFNYQDENITCEHCHGPGSEHVRAGGGRANAIINPKFLTAEAERQVCGKCHAYDNGEDAKPAQTYGFEYPWNDDWKASVGGGNFVAGVFQLADAFSNFGDRSKDDETFWDPAKTGGNLYGQTHRQQYTMLSQAVHTNNPYEKITCTSCHDAHSTYLGSTTVHPNAKDVYSFATADYRNNSLCLSCHAGHGDYAMLSTDDVAALSISAGGVVTKNGAPMRAPSPSASDQSLLNIALAVAAHMSGKAQMSNAPYNPTGAGGQDTIGRCTGCHMPKVAKSGGYTTDVDDMGNLTIVQGDQASHVFSVIWPAASTALSRSGPTLQSGYYGQFLSASNTKYDLFGYMPNSCSECHVGARRPSWLCPDTKESWPSYWPLNDPAADPNMQQLANCFSSTTAP